MPNINFPGNPSVNDTYTFGGKTWVWNGSYWALNTSGAINNLPVGNATPSTGAFTTLSSSGNTTLGNIAGNLIPAANVTYDLGSSSRYWNDLYLAGNTIYLGNLQLKEYPNNSLSVLSDNGQVVAPIFATATDAVNAISSGTAQFVTGNAQANITSVGTLTSLEVTGNVSGGNITTTGVITATGNITGNFILGNGSQLSGITVSAGVTTASTTPPVSPSQGDVWIDTNSGTQYLYFNDGNSSQWAEMEAAQSFYYYNSVTNSIGGNNTQLQYNDSGTFAGSASLTWDGSSLAVDGAASVSGNVTGGNLVTGGSVTGTTAVIGGGITLSGNTISSAGSTLTIDPSTAGQEGHVVIAGNLSVQGNVTYIDSSTVTTNEKDITLANNVNTTADVNGAGILLGNNSVVTFTYNSTSNAWVSNVGVSAVGNVTGGNISASAGSLTALTVTGTTTLQQTLEKATVSATQATGTINYDALTQSVLYYTSNASGNWTLNVRGNSSTSLDSVMSTGQSITLVFLVTQGSPAYRQTLFQVDAANVTPKWQGGSAPSAGGTNGIDAYTVSIIKTGSATFTALESFVSFA